MMWILSLVWDGKVHLVLLLYVRPLQLPSLCSAQTSVFTRKTCVNPHIHSGVSSWSWQIIIDWWYKKDQNVTVKDIINIAKLGQMCTISWHCDVKELNVMFTVITCQHGECWKDWKKKGLFVVDICHFIYSTEQWYTVVNQFNQWAEMKKNCTELMKYNWIMASKHVYKYFSFFNIMHIFYIWVLVWYLLC